MYFASPIANWNNGFLDEIPKIVKTVSELCLDSECLIFFLLSLSLKSIRKSHPGSVIPALKAINQLVTIWLIMVAFI